MVLETDKASVDVVAETEGTITIKAKAGDVVKIGAIVGEIDSDGKPAAAGSAAPTASAPAGASAAPAGATFSSKPTAPPVGTKPTAPPAASFKLETMSPSVRRVVS